MRWRNVMKYGHEMIRRAAGRSQGDPIRGPGVMMRNHDRVSADQVMKLETSLIGVVGSRRDVPFLLLADVGGYGCAHPFVRLSQTIPPSRPGIVKAPRAGAVKDGRRPPRQRRGYRVLDGPEHGAELAGGRAGRMTAPLGHALLFAVGAEAAASWGQEGEASQSVWRPAGVAPGGSGLSTRSPRPSSPRERSGSSLPTNSVGGLLHRHAATGSLPQRNSLPSCHIRCRMTASLRATATRARAMPRAFATFMPQARRPDHFRERTSSVWAASYRAVRASSSPHRLILPWISVSPDW